MKTIHHPFCSVIPPHILEKAADHPDEETRAGARTTLQQMQDLIETRHMFAQAALKSVPGGKHRSVYDARQKESLPGKLVRSEHKNTAKLDTEVMEAYEGSGATYDFFNEVFDRSSIDGRGIRLVSTVHYGRGFNNALWNGRQMIYGDGDGKLFHRFTAALEVIGHELTHGLTQYTLGLGYHGQSGALNEHISDAFGIMVKQYVRGESAEQSDWLMGAGLFASPGRGAAVRSLKAPGTAYDDPILGKDPQPSHMKDYVEASGDNGGVHTNSGIPNHAFYLAATKLGGKTWDVVGQVWYATLTKSTLTGNAGFHEFAAATYAMAAELCGRGGAAQTAIGEAWDAVGLAPNTPRHPMTALTNNLHAERPAAAA